MIYIEPIRIKWEPGKLIMKGYTREEVSQFEDYMAHRYVELVRERVEKQKFAEKWAPLSKLYLKYKYEKGWSLKTWKATGQLIKELKVKSNGNVGFDNRKIHKESGEKLIDIARKNEYGSLKVPARPLFRLVYWYMSKNVDFFFKKWLGGEKA